MARPKGTPNKRTQSIQAMLEARFPGWHPVLAMAEIANDPGVEMSIRTQMMREVASYVAPKRKALDLTSDGDKLAFSFKVNLK